MQVKNKDVYSMLHLPGSIVTPTQGFDAEGFVQFISVRQILIPGIIIHVIEMQIQSYVRWQQNLWQMESNWGKLQVFLIQNMMCEFSQKISITLFKQIVKTLYLSVMLDSQPLNHSVW